MKLKEFIGNILKKIIEEKIKLFLTILCGGSITLTTVFVTKKTVENFMPEVILQMANRTHTTENLINEKFITLLSKCGAWSGGAWAVYNNKTKTLKFIEVFANDPYNGSVYPTKYIDGNDFYRIEHNLDHFAYTIVNDINEYDIFDMDNELWQNSSFFRNLKNNIWKITNQKLQKLKLKTIAPKVLYLTSLKYNNDLIYIFALTVSHQKFCEISQMLTTENEKIHQTGVALKKITLEANQILKVF